MFIRSAELGLGLREAAVVLAANNDSKSGLLFPPADFLSAILPGFMLLYRGFVGARGKHGKNAYPIGSHVFPFVNCPLDRSGGCRRCCCSL